MPPEGWISDKQWEALNRLNALRGQLARLTESINSKHDQLVHDRQYASELIDEIEVEYNIIDQEEKRMKAVNAKWDSLDGHNVLC